MTLEVVLSGKKNKIKKIKMQRGGWGDLKYKTGFRIGLTPEGSVLQYFLPFLTVIG